MNNQKIKNKKYFFIRLFGGILFLLAGLVFAIVYLTMTGWDFIQFFTNPTVLLIALLGVAFGITLISLAEVK